ncbi:hypothetical protein [Actimicrobium antarcticum]|uniref:hypothetical protein n=1 Tax=Actimicrobium antarcticum TaxID=1051899 RepID=UPI0031DFFA84
MAASTTLDGGSVTLAGVMLSLTVVPALLSKVALAEIGAMRALTLAVAPPLTAVVAKASA